MLEPLDEPSVSLSARVKRGMSISIVRVTTKTHTEEFAEPYGTTEEETNSLKKGERKTVTEGKDGAGVRTYTVYYRDGEESSRHVTMQTITTQPVNEVVQVGTGGENPAADIAVPNALSLAAKLIGLQLLVFRKLTGAMRIGLCSVNLGGIPMLLILLPARGLAQALPCSKMGPN